MEKPVRIWKMYTRGYGVMDTLGVIPEEWANKWEKRAFYHGYTDRKLGNEQMSLEQYEAYWSLIDDETAED